MIQQFAKQRRQALSWWRATISRRIFLAALIASALPASSARSQTLRAEYRQTADVFEILDQVSEWWPGYTEPEYRRFWKDSLDLTAADSALFARYAGIRRRYYQTPPATEAPYRGGAWLFTDSASVTADKIGSAFYEATSIPDALAAVAGSVTTEELRFLAAFYEHFRPRTDRLTAETLERTRVTLALTARTLALPAVDQYVRAAARLVGVDTVPPLLALYVWWPVEGRTTASPQGKHLIVRSRPALGDSVNSADVVTHEAIHLFLALQPDSQRRTVSEAMLSGCGMLPPVRRLAIIEEPLVTALGNIEFRRRFMPGRFAWGREWYGDPWIDLAARLYHAPLAEAIQRETRGLDGRLTRDLAQLCGRLARSWRSEKSP